MNYEVVGMVCGVGLSLAALGVALAVIYQIGLGAWQRWHVIQLDLATRRLTVDAQRVTVDQARLQITQQVQADPQGVYPMLWDGQHLLDPNRGLVMSLPGGVEALTPALVQIEGMARLLRAAGGWPPGRAAPSVLDESPPVMVNWPGMVKLADLLTAQPTYQSLVLGVHLDGAGAGQELVKSSMHELVHVAVGGSSGWGKSVFLRSLAYQLAISVDPVDLVLVDLEGVTFAPFVHCDRLLWPVADTEEAARIVCEALTDELDRRKAAFGEHPGVDSLAAYNRLADAPLAPVVCLVDEATALLGDKGVESALRTLALRARKYGLWLVLGGQDWKASSLDTAIRNQLSTRVQFRAMSDSQSRVLLQKGGAELLDTKGRALAWLPGRGLVEIQTPYIGHADILAAVAGAGPREAFPEPGPGGETGPGADTGRDEAIWQLYQDGRSPTAIAFEVYGHGNTFYIRKVKESLARQQQQCAD
ncbi:MAG: hypothetical protein KKB13_12950 [Chloroflexi bacterium]|nr:hypothetical protein [Chloroflexota bacterium]